MGFWSSVDSIIKIQSDFASQDFSDEVQRFAKDLAYRYSTTTSNQETLSYINDFINKAKAKYPNIQYKSLFTAVAHAYESRGFKYPDTFHIHLAMEYLDKQNVKKQESKTQLSTSPQWYKQKAEEVENHLKHIALIKLQLTKNLKDLQSQNGGHLWIDTDFIDPATETLQASLTQIQDLESRLQVLKLTYQDHL